MIGLLGREALEHELVDEPGLAEALEVQVERADSTASAFSRRQAVDGDRGGFGRVALGLELLGQRLAAEA